MLVVLARNPRRILSVQDLLSAVWPDTVTSPASVYNCLKELRSALQDDPHDPRYIETFHKRGYRLVAPVRYPQAPGSKAGRMVPGAEFPGVARGARESTRWRGFAALAVVLAAVVAALLLAQRQPGLAHPAGTGVDAMMQAVAVLPFRDLSEGGADRYLGDGLALAIHDDLSVLPGFRVITPQSSFRFRDNDRSRSSIGALLDADLVMEGTIRRSGPDLTIEVNLTDARDGHTVWSHTVQTRADEIHLARNRLGEEVKSALRTSATENVAITPSSRPPKMLDSPAYERYLQSRSLTNAGDMASLLEALEILDQIVEAEPEFARARVFRLQSQQRLLATQHESWPVGRTRDLGSVLAYRQSLNQEAEELAASYPDLAEAHLALSHSLQQRDRERARMEAERALELNPNLAEAHRELGWLNHLQFGSWTKTVGHFRKAVSLDPYSLTLRSALVRGISQISDRRDEMWAVVAQTKERFPWSPDIGFAEAVALVSEGRYADAIRVLEEILERDEGNARVRDVLAEKWYALDRHDRSRRLAPDHNRWRDHPDDASIATTDRCPQNVSTMDEELLPWTLYVCAVLRKPQMAQAALLLRFGGPEDMLSDLRANLGSEWSAAIVAAWVYRIAGNQALAEAYVRIEERVLDGRYENGKLRSANHALLRARVSALRGKQGEAISWLNEYLDLGMVHRTPLDHPVFDEYRQMPRFRDLEDKRLALVQAQLAQLGLSPQNPD